METEDIFKKISGLNMSGLILLAARPGMGKTSFALNMARTVAEEKTAAVFSMEMSREQVSARLLVCAPSTENGRTHAGNICQRRYEIVRKRRRNFVVFRRQGGDKIKRFLAQKECSQFAASGA